MFIGFSAAKLFTSTLCYMAFVKKQMHDFMLVWQKLTNWTQADIQMNKRTMKITSKNRRGLFDIFIGNIKNEFYDEISVFLTFDISLQVGLSLKNLTK